MKYLSGGEYLIHSISAIYHSVAKLNLCNVYSFAGTENKKINSLK